MWLGPSQVKDEVVGREEWEFRLSESKLRQTRMTENRKSVGSRSFAGLRSSGLFEELQRLVVH